MISQCPDCGTVGKRIDWRPYSEDVVEHIFLCNNLRCVRAKLPWSVFISGRKVS